MKKALHYERTTVLGSLPMPAILLIAGWKALIAYKAWGLKTALVLILIFLFCMFVRFMLQRMSRNKMTSSEDIYTPPG
ncbi:MAG: hypothetical protein JWM20_386 [Patescibacteria group bacterium]|nr:hypothetical protein [Patescibacteria group bacterium]